MRKRDCEGGEETTERGFGLEDRSPEVEEGIAEVEEERKGTGETPTGKGKAGIRMERIRGKP
jgi:hypothetical protein